MGSQAREPTGLKINFPPLESGLFGHQKPCLALVTSPLILSHFPSLPTSTLELPVFAGCMSFPFFLFQVHSRQPLAPLSPPAQLLSRSSVMSFRSQWFPGQHCPAPQQYFLPSLHPSPSLFLGLQSLVSHLTSLASASQCLPHFVTLRTSSHF